jgi:hypothetical protein
MAAAGFTAAASEVSAADVVLLLDRVFSEYDRWVRYHTATGLVYIEVA